jgi:N-acetylglucosaminyl-diphospho-decaprenol L-rhamnosyltransferase
VTHLLARLGIVVPAWNAASSLEACLASLAPAAAAGARIVVVDDGSVDAAGARARARFPFARVVAHAERRGPAAAWNTGAATLQGRDLLLLLDSNTEAPVESLVLVAQFLDTRPDYAGAAARLVSPGGRTERSCLRLPRLATPFLTGTPFERSRSGARELTRYLELGFDHECDADVEQPPLSALMLRRAVFDALGGLDERFEVYFADVDLARRIADRGERLRFLAEARVVHHGGESVRAIERPVQQWHMDRLRYYRKHHGRLSGPFVKGCVALGIVDGALSDGSRDARPFRQRAREFAEFVLS